MNEFIIPYKTGEELLTLREDLFKARERILAAFPNIQQEYAERAAYSKYSKNDDALSALSPSLVRYVDVGYKKPKMTNKIPKNAEGNDCYREYVYDKDGNLLMSMIMWHGKIGYLLYSVDFEGFKYIFNIDGFYKENYNRYVCRMKYENGKLVKFEEYDSNCYSSGYYYSEAYYTVDGREFCTSQMLNYEFENRKPWTEHEGTDDLPEYAKTIDESMKKRYAEFLDRLKLPFTEENSAVYTHIYELTFDNKRKLQQIDEIRLDGSVKTIYPKKPKTPSGLPKTKESLKMLKQRLADKGYTVKKGVPFASFWQTFKEFVLNDKFDCAADDILWEPEMSAYGNSLHIARQFVHEDGDGQYEFMEQLNIDFGVMTNATADGEAKGTFWSDDDVEKFFAEVERTKEFNSIDPAAIVALSMFFSKV